MACSVYVFDAYGTLYDVHAAVSRYRDAIGPQAAALSDLWRAKQLEYTWIRTMTGAYRDFRAVTAEALDYAAARFGGLSPDLRQKLLAAYEQLDAYPDVKPMLAALKAKGLRTAILSNGTPDMLAAAAENAGIAALLDGTLSVDPLKFFKARPEVYALATAHFGVAPAEISFQSSNRWDVAAGAKFGFRAVWINRSGAPAEYEDMPPAHVLPSLEGLAGLAN
jgi:2-haloacid dehalogenase